MSAKHFHEYVLRGIPKFWFVDMQERAAEQDLSVKQWLLRLIAKELGHDYYRDCVQGVKHGKEQSGKTRRRKDT